MKSDEKLMVDYINGDLEAFNQLYTRYKNRVFGILTKKLQPEKVDDVFQAVFLKLHEKKHLYRPEYSFAPWFFTLIMNHIVDVYRKVDMSASPLMRTLEGHEPHAESIDYSIDIPSFEKLSDSDQTLLFKRFVTGHDYNEMAAELGQSTPSLRKRVSRLIQKIRKESKASGGLE
jgi:RNA polymerase sigma-70 factor (ECF subfamily)